MLGFSESNIVSLLVDQPRALLKTSNKFTEIVNAVKEMGFFPQTSMFNIAIYTWVDADEQIDVGVEAGGI
ncbi:hypothetical protein Scep_014721 [Stephania cephalantha]|uniref:Uncharacterized protein n=1 Tax=Stephania cephalantha TaxID=152367 RepID=A0AAP0P225_9MAGN